MTNLFFHPGDLNLTEWIGSLLILGFPIIVVFIFVYVFVSRKNK